MLIIQYTKVSWSRMNILYFRAPTHNAGGTWSIFIYIYIYIWTWGYTFKEYFKVYSILESFLGGFPFSTLNFIPSRIKEFLVFLSGNNTESIFPTGMAQTLRHEFYFLNLYNCNLKNIFSVFLISFSYEILLPIIFAIRKL